MCYYITMKKILVVDDDIHIGNVIEEVLSKEGYQILRAYSGTEALLMLPSQPDLILLDLMLPGMNGEEIISRVDGTPVIIISAKVDIDDKVGMLSQGASDYITKPFDARELVARVAVQLRKAEASMQKHILEYDELKLDIDAQMVSITVPRKISTESSFCDNASDIVNLHLTRTEFSILKILMQNPTQVITKSILLDRISEDTPDCTDSSLKVHISNLRRKLKAAGGKDYIEAVWGIGFKLRG